jgi:DNA-binding CsgD family transcriptional regulator
MSAHVAKWRFRRAAILILALFLGAGIFILRLADDNEANGILGLLVIPIGLVAAEFGWVGGAIAAAVSLGLFAIWNETHGLGAGPIGYLTRGVVFFGFAAAAGMLASRPSSFFAAGRHDRPVDTSPRALDGLAAGDHLSPRELEVLELLAHGATNAQIAARFVISEQTVKSHVKHILKKLDVGNRTEAALYYVQLYGPPSRLDLPETPGTPAGAMRYQTGSPAQPAPRRERSAKVAGFSSAGHVVVKLDDGRTIEVPLLDEMRHRFQVGSPALVYFDDKGILLGWYLPDAGIGIDLQDDDPRRRG